MKRVEFDRHMRKYYWKDGWWKPHYVYAAFLDPDTCSHISKHTDFARLKKVFLEMNEITSSNCVYP
jgi:hypothetical protein